MYLRSGSATTGSFWPLFEDKILLDGIDTAECSENCEFKEVAAFALLSLVLLLLLLLSPLVSKSWYILAY